MFCFNGLCFKGGVSFKAIDRAFIFRENATWAKIFVYLVPSDLINVSRSRTPAVSILSAQRPIFVRYVHSIAKLTIFWGGFLFSVAVEESKISGAEVPATVAPAEPSLNDRICSFVWDSRARNALLLYIHNIQLSREVDYLNSRDRMSCLERNECSYFVVAVVAVVSVVTAQNCCCQDYQRLPPTLFSSQSSMRPSLLSSLLASASSLLSAA